MPWTLDPNDHFEYDPQAAEDGWRETAGIRAATPVGHLPSVDLADVAILALAVAQDLMKPEMRALFDELQSSRFDPALLDRLGPLAWGLWYANTRRTSLEATAKGGAVSGATLAAALQVKARMMRVCEYLLIDHPSSGREVADIRSGTGHKDLARDLSRLANLYELHATLFGTDGGGHYRASDTAEAKRLSGRIVYELGHGQAKALEDAKDDASRAFEALRDAYERIARWASAIWNEDEYLPSLFSVRAQPTRAQDVTTNNTDTGATDTGATDTDAT